METKDTQGVWLNFEICSTSSLYDYEGKSMGSYLIGFREHEKNYLIWTPPDNLLQIRHSLEFSAAARSDPVALTLIGYPAPPLLRNR